MSDDRSWQAPGGQGPQHGSQQGPPRYGEYAPPGYGAPGYGAPGRGMPPGWVPPPKPGLVPLRPLGFGTLLGAPFAELRRNTKAVVGSALLIQGVITVASVLIVGAVSFFSIHRVDMADAGSRDAVTSGAVASILLSMLVPVVLGLVGSALLQGIIVTDVARGTVGDKLSMRMLWRAARGRILPLAGWILILAIALVLLVAVLAGLVALFVTTGSPALVAVGIVLGVLGAIGAIVLGVWLYTKTSLVPCLIVLESASIRRAIARSWGLTHRFFWRTFGVQALIEVIVNAISQIVTTPLALLFGFAASLIAPTAAGAASGSAATGGSVALMVGTYAVLLLVSLVISALTTVVQAAAVALIYIDLRMRKEGLDLVLVRYVEDRQRSRTTQGDPFSAPAAPGPSGAA